MAPRRARLEPVASAADPRLRNMGTEEIAGADQIAGLLRATPDERLDGLVAAVDLIQDARIALRKTLLEK